MLSMLMRTVLKYCGHTISHTHYNSPNCIYQSQPVEIYILLLF